MMKNTKEAEQKVIEAARNEVLSHNAQCQCDLCKAVVRLMYSMALELHRGPIGG